MAIGRKIGLWTKAADERRHTLTWLCKTASSRHEKGRLRPRGCAHEVPLIKEDNESIWIQFGQKVSPTHVLHPPLERVARLGRDAYHLAWITLSPGLTKNSFDLDVNRRDKGYIARGVFVGGAWKYHYHTITIPYHRRECRANKRADIYNWNDPFRTFDVKRRTLVVIETNRRILRLKNGE